MASATTISKIDIHDTTAQYERALINFERDTTVCEENRQYILRFLRDCQLGKTVRGRQKTKISERRLLKYIYLLRRINHWLGNKDLRQITQDDMEQFIARLERNALTHSDGQGVHAVAYADWTRRDIKVCLKKFYKWLLGNNRQYPELVAWVDTSIQDHAPPCLSIDEIRKCIEYATTIKGKALLWALFETGARIEELLNVRLCHVADKQTHFLIWIEFPKTYKRNVPVFEGREYLQRWLADHPHREENNAQLFPMSYAAVSKFLKRLGERALDKRITPHLLRHSFATWLASKKVGRYQMCKLLGWAMASDQPDRYIDRVGVVEEEAIQSIRGDELSRVEKENLQLKGTLDRLEAQCNQLQERLDQHGEQEKLLNELFRDERVLAAAVARIKQTGADRGLLR